MGLWLTDDSRFGEATGQAVLAIAVVASVALNAAVSPILGAMSDRGGRRLPFLLAFTVACIVPTALIGLGGAVLGAVLFIVANFAYQAALIYYDASIKLVSTPETRGRLSGLGTGIGYCGTIFVGLLIFFFEIPVETRFLLSAVLFGLFAIPVFVLVREARDPDRGAGEPRGRRGDRHRLVAPARGHDPACPAGARAAALPARAVLLLGRGQHADRGHERGRRAGRGPLGRQRQPGAPVADRRRGRSCRSCGAGCATGSGHGRR